MYIKASGKNQEETECEAAANVCKMLINQILAAASASSKINFYRHSLPYMREKVEKQKLHVCDALAKKMLKQNLDDGAEERSECSVEIESKEIQKYGIEAKRKSRHDAHSHHIRLTQETRAQKFVYIRTCTLH